MDIRTLLFFTYHIHILKNTTMKTTKARAVGILILICFTAILTIVIHSCQKNAEKAIKVQKNAQKSASVDPPAKYCVGTVTGTAPGDDRVCCSFLKKGSTVCIPCDSTGNCNGIWEATRRRKLISGICTIVIEITGDNDCIACPDSGKVLNTKPDSLGLFWEFKKKE
jgi:hypothetical protein